MGAAAGRSREEQIAKNETVFREVNERIERTAQDSGSNETFGFVCECGKEDCLELIHLTIFQYERLRANPLRFVVKEGHEIPDVEDIVEKNDGYYFVKKKGLGQVVAREDDQRG